VNDVEWDQYARNDWGGLGYPGQDVVNTRVLDYGHAVEKRELDNDQDELQIASSVGRGNYTLNSTKTTYLRHYTRSATDDTARKPSPYIPFTQPKIEFFGPDHSFTRGGSNRYEEMIAEGSSRRHCDQKIKIGLIVSVVLIAVIALFFLVWKRRARKSKALRGYRSARNQNAGPWDPRAEEGLLVDNCEGVVGWGWGESESESESKN